MDPLLNIVLVSLY